MNTPCFCANCGHTKSLHYGPKPHACALDQTCDCLRYVSEAEAQEIARVIREALREAVTP
jgi:hypothetical protein